MRLNFKNKFSPTSQLQVGENLSKPIEQEFPYSEAGLRLFMSKSGLYNLLGLSVIANKSA